MKTTAPQRRALQAIAAEDDGPYSAGVSPMWKLPGRMVDAYRVAGSLIDKGLVTRTGDYLYITDAGRAALTRATEG